MTRTIPLEKTSALCKTMSLPLGWITMLLAQRSTDHTRVLPVQCGHQLAEMIYAQS